MGRPVRVEIKGKDKVWEQAFRVEWEDEFPERKLVTDGAGYFLIEPEWMDDCERVAAQTFCRVVRAPDDPGRRQWIGSLIGRRGKN
ncbi:MAG: hypothetical protein L0229_11120 [Blastocatellia bacterium]|nr:hypothetical protein [Blastocatellia bacterium]